MCITLSGGYSIYLDEDMYSLYLSILPLSSTTVWSVSGGILKYPATGSRSVVPYATTLPVDEFLFLAFTMYAL